MRDLDENNSRNGQGRLDPFKDIEHMNIHDVYDDENDFAAEPKMQSAATEQMGHRNHSGEFDSRNPFFTHIHNHKKNSGLSLLSKRTLLVSVVVLVGFLGIFMWSWIFEVLGFISWTGTENSDKSNTQIAEVITLPGKESLSGKEFTSGNESTASMKEPGTPQIAMAPSPVQSHARSPKVKETSHTSLPAVSKTTNAAQGISTGGTAVNKNKTLHKENVSAMPAVKQESRSELNNPVNFEPRLEPKRDANSTHSTQNKSVQSESLDQPVPQSQPQLQPQSQSQNENFSEVQKVSEAGIIPLEHPLEHSLEQPLEYQVQLENAQHEDQAVLQQVQQMQQQAQLQMQQDEAAYTTAVIPAATAINNITPSNKIPSATKPSANKQETLSGKQGTFNNKQDTLLLNRKPNHYTIQILGMQDEQKLKAFLKQSPLKSKMSTYKTLREGKAWHVIVYGDFATKQQADEALLNLPQDIQKNKPWVRPMHEVQGAIRGKS